MPAARAIPCLTAEQRAEQRAIGRRYLDLACGGGRADPDALRAAFADAYTAVGLAPPELLVFDSPAACLAALADLDARTARATQWTLGWFVSETALRLRDAQSAQQTEHTDGQSVRYWLGELETRLGTQIRSEIGNILTAQLEQQLRDGRRRPALYRRFSRDARDGGAERLTLDLWKDVHLWGSHELYWIAAARFGTYLGAVYEPEWARRLDILERIGAECECWWPCEGFVVASERPLHVRFDAERRLHATTEPAVEYADGYAIGAWHGTRFPERWVRGGLPSAAEILRTPDVELRRIACELLGWERLLGELDARLLDRHPDPQIGELWEANLPGHGPECFLKVRCGTGRTFVLPVGRQYQTAREANAATYGVAPEVLDRLEVRT